MLLSCRRLLARHPSSGPLWSLCARMLVSNDFAGEGRVLPPKLWQTLVRALPAGDAWGADDEQVPLELVDAVIRPGGAVDVATAVAAPDCPPVPELYGEDRT